MNKKNLPIFLSFAVVLGIVIGSFFNGVVNHNLPIVGNSPKEVKIRRLINYIQRDYVDEVDTDKLLDGAISQILDNLDPHSVYIPKENFQQVAESMRGNFVGIGVQFRMIKDSITVVRPIKEGPSIKAGIKAGDRILIADKDTLYGKNISSDAIPKYLKGRPNTKVKLQVYRKSNDSLFTVIINRGKVNIKSVDVAYMINDSIGYIKLDRFARNTYREFKISLDKLLKNGMTDLILDLRNNGGGFIDIANKIADEFLEDGKLIVFTKNNKGIKEESFATEKGNFEKGGLYVLIDENTASASEILAGALQDNDKGTIIGRRSFGKGLVQEEVNLGDGSAVRLTIARYYTPTGRSIQKPYKTSKEGVKESKKNNYSYHNDIRKRYQNGEMFSKDSIKVNDSLKYSTPKGKIVYGGGGIIPDVFVGLDTLGGISNIAFGSINDFVFKYVDDNRKELLKKWQISNFVKNFDNDKTVYNKYLLILKRKTLPLQTEKNIRRYLKALIANELFGDLGFYQVLYQKDKMIQKVLELESNQ